MAAQVHGGLFTLSFVSRGFEGSMGYLFIGFFIGGDSTMPFNMFFFTFGTRIDTRIGGYLTHVGTLYNGLL